jgi:hypothetical protein
MGANSSFLDLLVRMINETNAPTKQVLSNLDAINKKMNHIMEVNEKGVEAQKSLFKTIERQNVRNNIAAKEAQIALNAENQLRRMNEMAIKKQQQAIHSAKMTMLTFGLSVLFAGMALKRLGDTGLKSLIDAYKITGTENSVVMQKTNELSASWEFMKFSIMNALNQSPLFLMVIDFLVGAINWLSSFINKFPDLGVAIVGAFAFLSVGGGLMVALGSISSFLSGTWKTEILKVFSEIFGKGGTVSTTVAGGMGTAAGEKGSVAGVLKTSMPIWQGIIGSGLVIYGVFQTVSDMTSKTPTPFSKILYDAIFVGAGVGILSWNPIAGILAGAVILISLLLSNDSKKTMSAIHKAFAKPGAYQLPEDVLWTGYSGTSLPKSIQDEMSNYKSNMSYNVGGIGMPSDFLNNPLFKEAMIQGVKQGTKEGFIEAISLNPVSYFSNQQ